MTSKLTRERIELIANFHRAMTLPPSHDEIEELARMALAAMDSEPVAVPDHLTYLKEPIIRNVLADDDNSPMAHAARILAREVKFWRSTPLYRHAQPAPASEPITVTDDMAYAFHHALADSMLGADDVEEIKTGLRAVFANLTAPIVSAKYPERLPCSVLLEPGLRFGKGIKTSTVLAALARRAVYESDMAALSPEEKAEFREKIADFKSLIAQPAPVVTFYRDGIEAAAKWIDQQREAYDSEHGWSDPDTGSFEFGNDAQREYSSTLEELAEGIRALHPNAGNSPVIPDGYVMVPMRLTAENGAKAALLGEFNLEYSLTCHECFGEGCDDCSGEGTWTNTIPIDWTTIKEIWAKGVEHFAAARRR